MGQNTPFRFDKERVDITKNGPLSLRQMLTLGNGGGEKRREFGQLYQRGGDEVTE